jgi:hypothetical protein
VSSPRARPRAIISPRNARHWVAPVLPGCQVGCQAHLHGQTRAIPTGAFATPPPDMAVNTYSQAVISWGSKKQVSVALSSCEADKRSWRHCIGGTSEAAKEALFLSRFLDELGHGSTEPIDRDGHGQSSHRLLLARSRGYIIIDIVRPESCRVCM